MFRRKKKVGLVSLVCFLSLFLLLIQNGAILLGSLLTNVGFANLNRTLQQDGMHQRDAASGEYWFRRALTQDQQSVRALYGLGRAYIVQGRYAEAVQLLEHGVESQPGNLFMHLALGDAYDGAGDRERAIREWQTDGVRSVLFRRGLGHEQDGDWAKAAYWYAAVSEVDPNWAEPYHRLGRVMQAQGMIPDAIHYLQQAVSLAPDDPFVRHQLGLTYMGQGQSALAIEQFEEVLHLLPDEMWTTIYLASLYLQQDNLDKAAYYARRAIAQSQHARPHFVLGTVYRRQGQVEMSIVEFAEAVRLASLSSHEPRLALSEVVEYHLTLAGAYRDAGQIQEAISVYKEVLALDPTNVQAAEALQALEQK